MGSRCVFFISRSAFLTTITRSSAARPHGTRLSLHLRVGCQCACSDRSRRHPDDRYFRCFDQYAGTAISGRCPLLARSSSGWSRYPSKIEASRRRPGVGESHASGASASSTPAVNTPRVSGWPGRRSTPCSKDRRSSAVGPRPEEIHRRPIAIGQRAVAESEIVGPELGVALVEHVDDDFSAFPDRRANALVEPAQRREVFGPQLAQAHVIGAVHAG